MTADAQGNDLTAVKYVTSSKIIIAPYDPTAKLTASMIAKTVADPITTLKDIFSKGHAVGLITSDRRTRETPMTPPNSTSPATCSTPTRTSPSRSRSPKTTKPCAA